MTQKKRNTIPKLRYHKISGRGFVALNGRRFYLGTYDAPGTVQKYNAKVAEWLSNGRREVVPRSEFTVAELGKLYWDYAKAYYVRPDGTPTNTTDSVKQAVLTVRKLYGFIPAVDFGPLALDFA